MSNTELLWQPLFEAAAQTIVGAVGTLAFTKAAGAILKENSFDGTMDLWQRGIRARLVGEGDSVRVDCQISPYSQLFPGDPFGNAKRWNTLYSFPGAITSIEYQSLEFFAGSDAMLRVGSLNGETLAGIYSRYGFVGEGLVGVVPTTLIRKQIPDFFHPDFVGARVTLTGRLARCPSQHGFVAQRIAAQAGISLDASGYRDTWYLQVRSINPFRSTQEASSSLLGSVWAATGEQTEQYLSQYGYIDNPDELSECINGIRRAAAWHNAEVYFDEIRCPPSVQSFRRRYL